MYPASNFSEKGKYFLLKLCERNVFEGLEQTNVKNSSFFFSFSSN
jgi:hypothetical protein